MVSAVERVQPTIPYAFVNLDVEVADDGEGSDTKDQATAPVEVSLVSWVQPHLADLNGRHKDWTERLLSGRPDGFVHDVSLKELGQVEQDAESYHRDQVTHQPLPHQVRVQHALQKKKNK